MHLPTDKSPPAPLTLDPAGPALPRWKRLLDLACCVAVLPLLALCTFAMALLMQIVSPGPVFFRQERTGHRGRRFKIYKFRTMKVGADTAQHQAHFKGLVESNAPMQKLDARGDHRLIPGAWLLRASGLDELPQLINVLCGDMSVVGPRPCLPTEYDLYLPWQKGRFAAVPGLTGLWQVSGKNRTSFEEMVRLDIRYAETKSLAMDLRIMLATVPAMIVQISDTRAGRRSQPGMPPSALGRLASPAMRGSGRVDSPAGV